MAGKPKSAKKPLTEQERKDRELAKSAKFKELANKRVPAAIKKIKHVGNLANRSSYRFTPEQKDAILQALVDAVDTVATKFNGDLAEQLDFRL